jgi:hypothetical protein
VSSLTSGHGRHGNTLSSAMTRAKEYVRGRRTASRVRGRRHTGCPRQPWRVRLGQPVAQLAARNPNTVGGASVNGLTRVQGPDRLLISPGPTSL